MKKNFLLEHFENEKRWVSWRPEKKGERITKIPYSVNGKLASSTDSKTWATYNEVKKVSENVGIVLKPDKLLFCLDIDHVLKKGKLDHEEKEKIADFILESDTYTEISPSGEGLHIFLALTEAVDLISNKKAPFEVYVSGRYMTFTGKCYGEPRPLRRVSPEELNQLLSLIGYPWNKKEEVIQSKEKAKASTNSLTDSEILEKMFSSKNGDKIKKLYEGNISDYKKDYSAAEMALCSYLAFWTNKDPGQMERIWLTSPLSNRKKTKERKDYRDRTIRAAIANCKEVYKATSTDPLSETIDFLHLIDAKGNKIIILNTENICRVINKDPEFSGRLRFDIFRNIIEIKENNKWRGIQDNDAVVFQTRISILYPIFSKVGKDMVYDAMIKIAKETEIDSAKDYITSIVWDKKKRLDNWLTEVYGTPKDEYHKAVASNWLKGLVKRICEPGCKFDYVLVLEGEQGVRKSTSLAVLGGDWHVETTMSTDTKDFFMQFQGKAIIEFSEGETLSRTEVKRMKAIITMQSDKYRPPYERASQDFPRRCVFAMTTNQTEYLKDETGNRRWLPVTVVNPKANVEWLVENRDQLFAEAYHRVFNLKETIYEFPEEETRVQQEARRIQDPNTDLIVDWYYKQLKEIDRETGVTIHQAFRDALHGGFNSKPLTRWEEMSIGDIFKTALKLEKKRTLRDGLQAIRWYKKGQVVEVEQIALKF